MFTVNLLSASLTISAGLILLFYIRFFFIFRPIRCVRRLCHLMSRRDLRRSLFLALAGTLGVGNIYGVSLGIILGGEGSVFWLFISSFFAMAVKYSECLVVTKSASSGKGMMIPIKNSFGTLGAPIASIYCICTLSLSLFMGAFIQSDSLITSVTYLFPENKILISVIFLFMVVAVISGGRGKIKNATEALIPIATLFYVILCMLVIIKDAPRLPSVIERIITSAFSPSAALGGALPVISFSAFSQGFARSLLSNEAGAGTSAMAHSESSIDPHDAGLFGIAEIFFDTNLLCMLTAFVILLESESPRLAESPMALVFSAFRSGIGKWSLIPLLICILLFAYSTVISWYYYGVGCLSYLGVERYSLAYYFFFCMAIIAPVIFDDLVAVCISDVLLLFMSIPTLLSLIINRRIISEETLKSSVFCHK